MSFVNEEPADDIATGSHETPCNRKPASLGVPCRSCQVQARQVVLTFGSESERRRTVVGLALVSLASQHRNRARSIALLIGSFRFASLYAWPSPVSALAQSRPCHPRLHVRSLQSTAWRSAASPRL